jgi:hypothetical protein
VTTSRFIATAAVTLLLWVAAGTAVSEEETGPESNADVELAKKSQNPLGNLISLPFEHNLDGEVGPEDGSVYVLNLKPVYPVDLSDDWLLINRFTVPIIAQSERFDGEGSKSGLGDTVYQAFVSHKKSPFIWGVGPALGVPTHTSSRLGNSKWLLGPSAVALIKPGPWLVGGLVQQLWSFAGDDETVSIFSLQYFINYTFQSGWYLTSTPTMTANWEAKSDQTWRIPVGGGFGKLVRFGKAPIDFKLQAFGFPEKPKGDASWSVQLQIKFLFPK